MNFKNINMTVTNKAEKVLDKDLKMTEFEIEGEKGKKSVTHYHVKYLIFSGLVGLT